MNYLCIVATEAAFVTWLIWFNMPSPTATNNRKYLPTPRFLQLLPTGQVHFIGQFRDFL